MLCWTVLLRIGIYRAVTCLPPDFGFWLWVPGQLIWPLRYQVHFSIMLLAWVSSLQCYCDNPIMSALKVLRRVPKRVFNSSASVVIIMIMTVTVTNWRLLGFQLARHTLCEVKHTLRTTTNCFCSFKPFHTCSQLLLCFWIWASCFPNVQSFPLETRKQISEVWKIQENRDAGISFLGSSPVPFMFSVFF